MKFTDIAWDFDGTIYNSYPHIVHCLTEGLRTLGITDSSENIAKQAHITLGHAYRYYAELGGRTPEEVGAAYRTQTEALGLSSLIVLYPGISALLRDIALSGRRNHICSNRGVEGCKKYLKRDGLDSYFDVYACPNVREGLASKPAPDLVSLILEERKISPDAMIMVGDRNLDHEAAHAAGVQGVFFDPDGFASISCSPEYVAENIEALRAILLS